MSSQNPANSHGSRTYWTPTMERYFIDLMLEHIHRGNRTGHTFKKQAWTDMLAVFNAKFGSQYDKDVLKSRYTNLWKQFNDIKNLLGQSGFSWDETRQMVVAEDYLWDAYIKLHPEARPYKTKAILNFDDMCLIYGYTVADGRYSRSSHDVDVEDEIQGTVFGNGNGDIAPSSSSSRTEWTSDMDDYFIKLMLNQQEKGNKHDNTFTKQAWTDMLKMFNAKFGSDYSKRVLRHRYRKLCKYYSAITTLVKQKGFCWDEKEQMVVADDSVWDAYLKAHPYARPYRAKIFLNYDNLRLIIGDIISDEGKNDIPENEDGKNEAVAANSVSVRSRTCWTPPMDRFFIDLMLEQVSKGNQIRQSFITQAWNDMVSSFNENFRYRHDKEVLKNRYKHFKKQYNDVKILLQHSGFSWDEAREMVTAEDAVWDAYIKAHPDARPYRVKAVPCYHKLGVIYGKDKLDGVYSVTPTTEIPGMRVEGELNSEDVGIKCDQDLFYQTTDEYHPTTLLDPGISDNAKKRASEELTDFECGSKVQKSDKEGTEEALTSVVANKEAGKSYVDIESAIEALQAIPDVDDELLLDGCDLLEDERKAKTFLALDGNLRKKWLLRKLGRS